MPTATPPATPFSRRPELRRRAGRLARAAIAGLWTLAAVPAWAQSPPSGASLPDSALQALYLYNFAKFIDWPEKVFADKQAPIRLCIYGERPNDIRQSIGAVDGKLAQGREVRVRPSATLSELSDCQIVFIPGSERRWLPQILSAAHTASALTVSDMDDFVELGGAAGLVTIEQHIRFEFNLQATQAANLKISSRLLKLARDARRP